jgi:carboxymethylenebutenolidase
MCDEDTEADNATFLTDRRPNRREVGIGAGAMVAAVLTGCGRGPASSLGSTTPTSTSESSPTAGTASRMVTIATPDGAAEAFFVTPTSGRHPGVILWPDVAGLRDAYETMATRLAESGYAVLAVNQYYRSARLPVLTSFAEWGTDEGKAKLAPMREAITPEGIARDGAAFAAWLDQQREVDTGRKLATSGYCMGGPFTFRTAAAAPDRIGVIASFHGGGLVTDEPTSPHALLPRMKVAALICIARNDDARDPTAKTTLQQAAAAAHVPAEIEVYPAQHGWCTLDSPVYDPTQAERAWERMLATFGRYL